MLGITGSISAEGPCFVAFLFWPGLGKKYHVWLQLSSYCFALVSLLSQSRRLLLIGLWFGVFLIVYVLIAFAISFFFVFGILGNFNLTTSKEKWLASGILITFHGNFLFGGSWIEKWYKNSAQLLYSQAMYSYIRELKDRDKLEQDTNP